MHVLHVVGARPNFMKLAPVYRALREKGFQQTLVHTGQHYDASMSDVFFRDLEIPEPDLNLNVGSGSHSTQTAEVMVRLEPVITEQKPDWVLVYGDVNSTVAAALVCAKLLVRLAHVEAGLRSGDRTMPEEINRMVTDRLADLLFTPSRDGDENLLREGIAAENIRFVGNVMIDTLVRLLPLAEERWKTVQRQYDVDQYALVTLHRPSNVDHGAKLLHIVKTLAKISAELPILFPIHPRTRERLGRLDFSPPSTLRFMEPLGYLHFLALQQHASVVITDSGGIQEETTYLGTPCLTLRENTERPVTVTEGTNILVGGSPERLSDELRKIIGGKRKRGTIPAMWDGNAAKRIAAELIRAGGA